MQRTGCVSAFTNGTCGTTVLLRAPCPGSRSLHSTGTSYLLSAQVPWLDQERVTYQGSERLCFLCELVSGCVSE